MRRSILIMGAVLLLLNACPDSPTNPQDDNPYRQQPVDWPSLADSPWPMYHGGPQGNGLAFCDGPKQGAIQHQYEPNDTDLGDGIVIDSNGNLYTSSLWGYLYSLDSQLNERWKLHLYDGMLNTSPAPMVLEDNKILIIMWDKIFVVDQDGLLISLATLPSEIWASSPNIDKSGTLYVTGTTGTLFSFGRNGTINWQLVPPDSLTDKFIYNIGMPVFFTSSNEMVVAGEKNIYKVSTTGQILSHYPAEWPLLPVITYQDYVIFSDYGNSTLICLSDSFEPVWKLPFGNELIPGINRITRPAVDIDGNIIVPGEHPQSIIKISPEGEVLWQYIFADEGTSVSSEIITDMDGTIYTSTDLGNFYAVNRNGNLLWSITGPFRIGMSPALSNGRLYFSETKGWGKVYEIQ